ncbi:PTS sugar transporter subunit IIB [Oceanispirochaeta sp. M1]|nr:PTS sugar transporter subunit IIB [Oceanispirochaeta sp. M1]RDG31283.1 PTS galactitol transporter subunit IIB [Oceanispirochaeta sp. M1]
MGKKILVCCGTAIATSTVVLRKIEEILEEKGITGVRFDQCKASEVSSKLNDVDLIVTTTMIFDVGDIPVIQTLSFLTGIGIENDMNKIISYLEA